MISLEGRLRLNMYVINPKATIKITKQRISANMSIKDILYIQNHTDLYESYSLSITKENRKKEEKKKK